MLSDDDLESMSREESPCSDSPRHVSIDAENSYENMGTSMSSASNNLISTISLATKSHSKVCYVFFNSLCSYKAPFIIRIFEIGYRPVQMHKKLKLKIFLTLNYLPCSLNNFTECQKISHKH